jgi:hypothetical protein
VLGSVVAATVLAVRAIRRFTVRPVLPEVLKPLGDLARSDDRYVLVHAVWRDLAIEAGACRAMAQVLSEDLNGRRA